MAKLRFCPTHKNLSVPNITYVNILSNTKFYFLIRALCRLVVSKIMTNKASKKQIGEFFSVNTCGEFPKEKTMKRWIWVESSVNGRQFTLNELKRHLEKFSLPHSCHLWSRVYHQGRQISVCYWQNSQTEGELIPETSMKLGNAFFIPLFHCSVKTAVQVALLWSYCKSKLLFLHVSRTLKPMKMNENHNFFTCSARHSL